MSIGPFLDSRNARPKPRRTAAAALREMVRNVLRATWSRSGQSDRADRERLLVALGSGPPGATAEELAIQTLIPVERTWRLLHQARSDGTVASELRRGRLVWESARVLNPEAPSATRLGREEYQDGQRQSRATR